MRMILAALALLASASLALPGVALAQGYDKDSPTDNDNGKGNDPGKSGKAPGHKFFDDTAPVWLDGFILAHHTNGADKHGTDKPSGSSGPGQKGQPGQEGGPSGP